MLNTMQQMVMQAIAVVIKSTRYDTYLPMRFKSRAYYVNQKNLATLIYNGIQYPATTSGKKVTLFQVEAARISPEYP